MTPLREAIEDFRALDEGLWGRLKKAAHKVKHLARGAKEFIKRDWHQTGRLISRGPAQSPVPRSKKATRRLAPQAPRPPKAKAKPAKPAAAASKAAPKSKAKGCKPGFKMVFGQCRPAKQASGKPKTKAKAKVIKMPKRRGLKTKMSGKKVASA